jgi:glycosyltransferase involved in cell wall biosynthesis
MADTRPGLVSVMMPAFNAAAYIRSAIESVFAQTYADWELLIVDDGSTDATAAVAGEFTDPRVRVFNKANGGESSARNVALDRAAGEFIAYLDADDLYLPDHLALTVGYLRDHPALDAVYTDGFHMDEAGTRLATLQSRRRGPFEGRLFDEVVRASDVFGPPMCVVLRHALVATHGLRYDPRIVIGPDWDFFVRVADVARFGYIDRQTGMYRVHQSNITAQVGAVKRAASLAICREKAIRMSAFNSSPDDVRIAVFYDLLIDLLRSQPGRRAEVVGWPEFSALPAGEQSRLLRLMAVDAVQHGVDLDAAGAWLDRARRLNPSDRRAAILAALYRLSPAGCRALVRATIPWRGRPRAGGPFADLAGAPGAGSRGQSAGRPV